MAIQAFKFGERHWIDAFFQNGSVRIGTLDDFRDLERHGSERGDAHEGELLRAIEINSAADLMQHSARFGHPYGDPERFLESGSVIRGCVLADRITTPNIAVYCMTYSPRKETAEAFGSAGFEIIDMEGFLGELDIGLRRIVPGALFAGVTKVAYGTRSVDYRSETVNPAFIKPERYRSQFEVRAAWYVGDVASPFFDLPKTEAARFCREVHVHRLPSLADKPLPNIIQPLDARLRLRDDIDRNTDERFNYNLD